jgi:hypothetical protein
MSNAENWALYALAKYVEATLDGAYPFRPLLDKDFPEARKIIKTIADNGLSGFWATEAFSKAGVLSQLHYNATRYQYLSNSSTFFTFNSSFSAYTVADLTTVYFARYDTAYNTSINNFLDGIKNQSRYRLWNYKLKKSISCFNKTNISILQQHDSITAFKISRDFCNKHIRQKLSDNSTATQLENDMVTPVRDGLDSKKAAPVYTIASNSSKQMTFAVGANVQTAVSDRVLANYFEGVTTDQRVESCERIFGGIVSDVSHTNCKLPLSSVLTDTVQ